MQKLAAQQQSPLTGRQRERDRLWNLFEASTIGHTHVVFVSGEPGIGKTRLLNAVAERAEQSGRLVLRGGASEAEGMPPYLPFLEALGQHIRVATPDRLREQTGELASVLAAILPELSLRLGELPTSYPLQPEQARLRLYEAVGAFLVSIAAPQGLLLLLDDVQWTDTATLDLLCYFARSQPNARLLVLSAYREGEVTHRSAFERAVHVDGFNSDEDSITAATTAVAEVGLDNRVTFAVCDATDLGLVGTYDLVLACNAIHDMARPVEALLGSACIIEIESLSGRSSNAFPGRSGELRLWS